MPAFNKYQIRELAAQVQIDHRTCEALLNRFRAGEIPPAAKLLLELQRRGIEVVSAPASAAK